MADIRAARRILYGVSGGALAFFAVRRFVKSDMAKKLLAPADNSVCLERSVLLMCPPADVYRAWRNFEKLPQILRHVVDVTETADGRSHWTAKVLAGTAVVEWNAQIVDDVEGEVIAWRSLPGSDIEVEGRVTFEPAMDGAATMMHVEIDYGPGGKALAVLNKAVVEEMKEDLRRFKAQLETGEIPTIAGQSVGANRKSVTLIDIAGGKP